MSKKGNLKRVLLCVSIIILSMFVTAGMSAPEYNNVDSIAYSKYVIKDTAENVLNDSDIIAVKRDSIRKQLIDEVEEFIRSKTKKHNDSISYYIVDNALSNDIDICFVMCQTQSETNFGTTGIGVATSRKSMFGIYHTYKSYSKCVEAYIDLLKTNYLIRGKTTKSLLNNYVNKNGHRYASDLNYEKKLRNAYSVIKNCTNIYILQQRYKELII